MCVMNTGSLGTFAASFTELFGFENYAMHTASSHPNPPLTFLLAVHFARSPTAKCREVGHSSPGGGRGGIVVVGAAKTIWRAREVIPFGAAVVKLIDNSTLSHCLSLSLCVPLFHFHGGHFASVLRSRLSGLSFWKGLMVAKYPIDDGCLCQ